MGLITTLGPLGLISGPVLGGLIVDGLGWPRIFFVNLPPLATVAWALSSYQPEGMRAASCWQPRSASPPSSRSCTPGQPTKPPRVDQRQTRLPPQVTPRHKAGTAMPDTPPDLVGVRYLVNDVKKAIDFYTSHLGFIVRTNFAPAFAEVTRGNLRLLLSGPTSSAGRAMPDGALPGPGGWNRIHLVVDDLAAEVDRLRTAGLSFRNDIVTGPGGQQILLEDPSGNLVELFQPAG